jgi:FkbM family methyltransferase
MRGCYRDEASRAEVRTQWAELVVPGFVKSEVRPIVPLVPRSGPLVAIDVGANKGFWSKALLQTFPDMVDRIYMIDPSPENYAELTNREDNLMFSPEDLEHLSAFNFAAGAEEGTATLYTNEDGSPLASLYPHLISGKSGANMGVTLDYKITTDVKTIDSFMDREKIVHADIMKMDTEGHEFDVLLGAGNALKNGKIDCLFWEFGMHQVESRHFFIDFYEYLTRCGYRLYQVVSDVAVPIFGYSYIYENFTTNFSFAATRADAVPEWFCEDDYLSNNPDVKVAVEAGAFKSGLDHWIQHGRNEHRLLQRPEHR